MLSILRPPYHTFLIIAFVATIGSAVSGLRSVGLSQESTAPQKYALLVAVNRYEDDRLNHPPLKYAEADAIAIKELLDKSDYRVETLIGEEATQANIRAKLSRLNKKGNARGVVVLGFFGHGVEFESTKEAMYIPFDASRRLAKDADGRQLFASDGVKLDEPDPATLIGMSELLDAMQLCKAGNKLLLADCCRNNPNAARSTRAFGSSVKLSDLPRNSAAVFACSEGEEAHEDDAWQHGALTKCFLDLVPELSEEFGDVGAMAGRLRKRVEELVSQTTKGTKHQTVHPIVNGVVEMQLSLARKPSKPQIRSSESESASMSKKPAEPSRAESTSDGLSNTIVANSIGMQFKLIPAGSFKMGSSTGRNDETPHLVTLTKPFYLGTHEVTQEQFEKVMRVNPSGLQGLRSPVENVSWEDAVKFCLELSKLPAERAARNVYRLPTEAEWEYACRAGSTTDFGFVGSIDQLADYAWYEKVSNGTTHPVGQNKPNQWGLYDMHGNVFEWVQDWYGIYPSSAVTDPTGPSQGIFRVLRGGSWNYEAMRCRSASRNKLSPTFKNSFNGFRVLKDSAK